MLLRLFIGLVSIMVWTGSGLATETASVSKDTPTVAEQDHALAASQEVGEYRIGPEDMLDISVWNNSAISRTVPVRPDGKISLPLVNDVQAAGLTPNQLRSVLLKKLAEYVPSPEVSVIVREVHDEGLGRSAERVARAPISIQRVREPFLIIRIVHPHQVHLDRRRRRSITSVGELRRDMHVERLHPGLTAAAGGEDQKQAGQGSPHPEFTITTHRHRSPRTHEIPKRRAPRGYWYSNVSDIKITILRSRSDNVGQDNGTVGANGRARLLPSRIFRKAFGSAGASPSRYMRSPCNVGPDWSTPSLGRAR